MTVVASWLGVCAPAPAVTITNSLGVAVTLNGSGNYTVQSSAPAWTFGGSLGATPAGASVVSGTDGIGGYSEITFSYFSGVNRAAAIRLYDSAPVVLFTHTYLAASVNDLAFPVLTCPAGLQYVNYGGNMVRSTEVFAPYDFAKLHGDSPWLFFDSNCNSFVISPAANYMIANDSTNANGSICCGINSGITNLPANFTHKAILVIQNGINSAMDTWGNALTGLSGKVRPANDAALELNKLGYWTDHFATYYYSFVSNSYPATLMAVRDEFASKGFPLAYMQLDSWWYPKGAANTYLGDGVNSRGGINRYIAAPELFTNGLTAFQQQLGLPLITHSRWIDPASPYNAQYAMSTNTSSGVVCVDPRFWADRMAYLTNGGVITYEQDWLDQMGLPAMNLNDPPAFMDQMAVAASACGLNMQYCMPRPRHFLQSTLYNNLVTIRVSDDGFVATLWDEFIYDSRFAAAVGAWPWTDVFFSGQARNLLIGTLSAGPVGVGDALGAVNSANLSQAVRADSVIVKPDAPLLPLDCNYINDAQGRNLPMVASTYTDHGGVRNYYVLAYARNTTNINAGFALTQLGITNAAYVYDYFNQTGKVVAAGSAFNFTTTVFDNNAGGSYFIVAPLGASGIGFVGDMGKFATAGKKRISALADSGSLTVTMAFAVGESNVTLVGYAPFAPQITASKGTAGLVAYSDRQFKIAVSPDHSGTATLILNVVSNNLPQVTTPTIAPGAIVFPGTVVTVTEILLPPWNATPFAYQWQSNNVNIGSAVSSSSPSNSFSIDTTGFAEGTYNYSVVVSNAEGSFISAPVTLVIPANVSEAPDGNSQDWNAGAAWEDGAVPTAANNYFTITNTTGSSGFGSKYWGVNFGQGMGRQTATGGTAVFLGGSYTISPGSYFLLKMQSEAVSANFIFTNYMGRSPTAYPMIRMASGSPNDATLDGTINNWTDSYIAADTSVAANLNTAHVRLTTSATVVGDANHSVTLLTGNATSLTSGCYPNTATNRLTGDWSGFAGTLNLGNNSFMCSNGVYELNPSATMQNLSLTMARADETLVLDTAITVKSFSITNRAVPAGTYTASQLAGLGYGGIFSGSGSLTVNNAMGRSMDFAAVSASSQTALTWQPVAGATGYVVKRGTSSGTYDTIFSVGNATSYTDTALVNGVQYFYVVVATNGAVSGANSVEIAVTPSGPPAAPSWVSVTATAGQVNLAWTASPSATGYYLSRGTTPGGPYTDYVTFLDGPYTTNYTDTQVAIGTTYYYVVAATNAAGLGANSPETSMTPVTGIVLEASTGAATGTTWNQGSQWVGGAAPTANGLTYVLATNTTGSAGEGTAYWGVNFGLGRIRTPGSSSGTDAFAGSQLIVASGSELLIKETGGTVNVNLIFTNYYGNPAYSPLVKVGANGSSDVTLTGTIVNQTDSFLAADAASSVFSRLTLNSTVLGTGSITLLTGKSSSPNAGCNTATNAVVGDWSGFNGTLNLANGHIMCSNGVYDLNPSPTRLTNLVLSMGQTGIVVVLDKPITVKSFSIAGRAVSRGIYTPAQLQALGYGGTFTGSGSLTVGETRLSPRIADIGLTGTILTVSATNGSANETCYLLTSTNLALPLDQWTPVSTNTFDNNGNLNWAANTGVQPSTTQFYIIQAK